MAVTAARKRKVAQDRRRPGEKERKREKFDCRTSNEFARDVARALARRKNLGAAIAREQTVGQREGRIVLGDALIDSRGKERGRYTGRLRKKERDRESWGDARPACHAKMAMKDGLFLIASSPG